jgi:hypothetical protein
LFEKVYLCGTDKNDERSEKMTSHSSCEVLSEFMLQVVSKTFNLPMAQNGVKHFRCLS